MIEPEVAVEKLNSMTEEEILAEANSINCTHKQGDAKQCIIANILRNWTGIEDIGVTPSVARFGSYFDSELYDLAAHIGMLIDDFDRGVYSV